MTSDQIYGREQGFVTQGQWGKLLFLLILLAPSYDTTGHLLTKVREGLNQIDMVTTFDLYLSTVY